jgi:hypothetical protein
LAHGWLKVCFQHQQPAPPAPRERAEEKDNRAGDDAFALMPLDKDINETRSRERMSPLPR